MKGKIYHLCYTSHGEVLCRKFLDYCMLFNCIAQATICTDAQLLAYAIMSSHVHLIVITGYPAAYIQRIRSSYTQMFNIRYHRKGALGEPSFFSLELKGRHHIAAAISYVLRNPSGYEVCVNPYDYPFSSINLYFKSMIVSPEQRKHWNELKGKKGGHSRLISVTNSLPEWIDIDSDGRINPAQIVCSDLVEGYFGSYNAFDFGLSRRDYEQWNTQQMNDELSSDPVTLASIEPYMSAEEVSRILRQNPGWIKEKRIKDIDLCNIVDSEFVPQYHKKSYACLSTSEKLEISRKLLKNRSVTVRQVERCLGVTL